MSTAVDIVLCIDVTGSMGPVIDKVKQGAMSFHERLETVMARRGMEIGTLRLKVLAFRDYCADRNAIETTSFLPLPLHSNGFQQFINGLKASGGGDAPESGLEALALAMRSPWNPARGDRRNIIVLFTDASAHPLGHRKSVRAKGYPKAMPKSMTELHDMWGRPGGDAQPLMNPEAKRLLMFAPEHEPWPEIADTWDKTLFVPSTAGTGLEDIALDEVISTIASSL
jgi:hypothetical protein